MWEEKEILEKSDREVEEGCDRQKNRIRAFL